MGRERGGGREGEGRGRVLAPPSPWYPPPMMVIIVVNVASWTSYSEATVDWSTTDLALKSSRISMIWRAKSDYDRLRCRHDDLAMLIWSLSSDQKWSSDWCWIDLQLLNEHWFDVASLGWLRSWRLLISFCIKELGMKNLLSLSIELQSDHASQIIRYRPKLIKSDWSDIIHHPIVVI